MTILCSLLHSAKPSPYRLFMSNVTDVFLVFDVNFVGENWLRLTLNLLILTAAAINVTLTFDLRP